MKSYLAYKQVKNNFIGVIIIICTGGLTYANSFSASFHFDDFLNIVNNVSIYHLEDISEWLGFNPRRFVCYFTTSIIAKLVWQ